MTNSEDWFISAHARQN